MGLDVCSEVPAFVVVCRSSSLRDIVSADSHPPDAPPFSAILVLDVVNASDDLAV